MVKTHIICSDFAAASRPFRAEAGIEDVEVEGEIPRELNGVFSLVPFYPMRSFCHPVVLLHPIMSCKIPTTSGIIRAVRLDLELASSRRAFGSFVKLQSYYDVSAVERACHCVDTIMRAQINPLPRQLPWLAGSDGMPS